MKLGLGVGWGIELGTTLGITGMGFEFALQKINIWP
jgi:hypothetical protein